MSHPERIVPDETSPGILAIHLKRYAFARPLCAGRETLDAACGVGYGSAYLGEVASSVVGVDISDDAIGYASSRYRRDKVSFHREDVTRLSFPPGSFDAVVSFETIEHVDEPEAAVREAARVLRRDGVYIVSTPKAETTDRAPANPFHRVELSPGDFTRILGDSFDEVEVYGQRRPQTRRHWLMQRLDVLGLRRRIPAAGAAGRLTGTPPMSDLSLDDLVIERDALEDADDLLAVCRRPR